MRQNVQIGLCLGLTIALACGDSEPSTPSTNSSATAEKDADGGRTSTAAVDGGRGAPAEADAHAAASGAGGAGGAPIANAGATAQGGAAGMGSAGRDGATSGAAGGSGDHTFLACPNATPPTDTIEASGDYPACDGSVKCGGEAHCFPTNRLSDKLLERAPDCSAGKCVPDEVVHAGKIQFKTCVGDGGDGRCMPQCFAIWAMPLSSVFERGAYGCGREEVCTPCISPLDETPTGACPTNMCSADGEP